MFSGEYYHSIDAKGRLIIPAKLREELGDKFVITKGYDGNCLSILPMKAWEEFENKLAMVPKNNKAGQKLVRYFTTGASKCELDKQGRVLIDQKLREHAGLDKEVVLAGVLERVEIWDRETYEADCDIDLDEAMSSLAESGIEI